MTIFLDIDGVLNHGTAMSAFADDSITEYAINNLNNIIEHFGDSTEIIVTSQWKDAFPPERVVKFLVEKGMKCNNIGITPIDVPKEHGIKFFCDQNNIKDFFVLDDNFDSQDNFFQNKIYKTNTYNGLIENDVMVIKRTFSDKVNNLSKYYFTPEELKYAFDSINKFKVTVEDKNEENETISREIDTIQPKELIHFLFKTKYNADLF